MSDSPGKPKSQRRGFKVEGEGKTAGYERTRPRNLDRAFGLDREAAEDEAQPEGAHAYDPKRVEAFLAGYITLGDLEGISKQEQYQMAEVGHGYLSSGRLEKARKVFTGLLALDPFDAYFNLVLGSIDQQEDKLADAEKAYSRSLQYNPFSASAYANRGEVRIQLGRLTEGAEDLIKAIERDPQGSEQATLRARATLMVLRDQLANVNESDLQKRAQEATDSKVKAKPNVPGPPKAMPRSGPPAKPSASRPGPAPKAGPRKK